MIAMIKNTHSSYGSISKALHWLMAFLIFGMLAAGFVMVDEIGSLRQFLFSQHKLVGLAVLGLATLRLLWKFINPSPALPKDLGPLQKRGAQTAHYVLYLLMIGMPLAGWAMISASGLPVTLGESLVLPRLVEPDADLYIVFKWAHGTMAYFLAAFIFFHVLAALYHHFVRKDDVLIRMMPCNYKSEHPDNC